MNKLSLYYPVKPYSVNQKFGETRLLDYYNTNGVGIKGHNGIDLRAAHGQEVFAAHDGIAYPEVDSKQGWGVVLRTKEQFDFEGKAANFKTIYWHLIANIPIFFNQEIKAGDLLGYADSTGLSTGDHLHFGLKPGLVDASGNWYNLVQDNGYLGAIDPEPYFNGMSAEDLRNPPVTLFEKNMYLGEESPEVLKLQIFLQKLGYFPYESKPTGYYGPITKEAVFTFQEENVAVDLFSKIQVFVNRGLSVRTLTRAALNKILLSK